MKLDPAGHVWQQETYYVVAVKLTKSNVEHRSIFYSGFLNDDKQPSSYACLLNALYDDGFGHHYMPDRIHSMRIIGIIDMMKEPTE